MKAVLPDTVTLPFCRVVRSVLVPREKVPPVTLPPPLSEPPLPTVKVPELKNPPTLFSVTPASIATVPPALLPRKPIVASPLTFKVPLVMDRFSAVEMLEPFSRFKTAEPLLSVIEFANAPNRLTVVGPSITMRPVVVLIPDRFKVPAPLMLNGSEPAMVADMVALSPAFVTVIVPGLFNGPPVIVYVSAFIVMLPGSTGPAIATVPAPVSPNMTSSPFANAVAPPSSQLSVDMSH